MKPLQARTIVIILAALMALALALRWAEATPRNIAMRQGCLYVMGYDVGDIDGVFGPKTQASWRRYMETRFGPHWETVPSQTRVSFLDTECQEVYQRLEQDTLPTYSR